MSTAALANAMPSIHADDADLAHRFSAGDGRAFEQVVSLYQARVARLTYRLLGWSGDVDDVVQDVFVTALEKCGNFRGESSLWTWLTAITVNRCRSRQRRMALFKRFRLHLWNGRGETEAAADRPAIEDETSRRVRAAVAALPAGDREVIVLHHLEDRPTAELSRLLGASTNAIDVRLHRARKKLKAMLSDLGMEGCHER